MPDMDGKFKNIIPVCTITDENLAFTVPPLLISIMENALETTFYKFYCFITKNVSADDRKKICATADMYENCTMELVDMGDKYLDCINRHPSVTNACLYKFAIAPTLTQYDKVLYLDTDIIVNEDLSKLFSTDLKNNYIAGVFNIYYHFHKKNLAQILDIQNLNSYINAGVMLMNTKLIRDENLTPKLESQIGKFQDSVDQHIFNKVCFGRIMKIAPKYNVTLKYAEMYEKPEARIFYTEKEIEETLKSPAILHYTGVRKPWAFENIPLAGKWYSYYLKSPYKDVKLEREEFEEKIKDKKSFLTTLKRKIFNYQMKFNKYISARFGISNDYFNYFHLINFYKSKNASPIMIMTDSLKDTKQNRLLLALIQIIGKRNEIVLLSSHKGALCSAFQNEKVKLFIFKKRDSKFAKSLKVFKMTLLSDIEMYNTAEFLNSSNYSYIWFLSEKPSNLKNKIINQTIENSKNVLCTDNLDTLISKIGNF